jgi:hypothetical protein
VTRLKAGRDFANLGKLAKETGWKHFDLIARLEAKRKEDRKKKVKGAGQLRNLNRTRWSRPPTSR